MQEITKEAHKILVVDDEESILFALKQFFKKSGYEVDCAEEMEEAEALMANKFYSVVILDLCLTSGKVMEGLELVRFVRQLSPRTEVIIMTAYGSIEVELEALRRGAKLFLHKPQPLPKITQIVKELLSEVTL